MPTHRIDIDIGDSNNLEFVVLDHLKKGKIIKVIADGEEDNNVAHYDIYHLRKTMAAIDKLYQNPKSTKEDFAKALKEHRNKAWDDINHILDEKKFAKGEPLLKVVDRKDTGKQVTITFERINNIEKTALVQSIAARLIKQLSTEDVTTLLQEAVRKLNDTDKLKKIDAGLAKKKPKIEAKRGCFKLIIEGEELVLVE